jgi:serine-type D-Ala-D-Ala carboxypeptidase (penicillin-binding protein 5/6)
MFNKYLFFPAIFVITSLIFGIYLYLSHPHQNLVSPVLGASKVKLADNLWFPDDKNLGDFKDAPQITAESAFFVETQTGQILYAKNPHQKLSIASLVKIMTVILAMQNLKMDDKLTVSEYAANMEPDHMMLKKGEVLTLKELLDGVFLVSANDAAEVLAEETTGDRAEFIKLMNTEAKLLGMKDTHIINPTGLEEDNDKQYSTAYDVALMSRYAIKTYPELINISSQPYVFLPETDTHQDYEMYSGINLLTTYPGVVGFKTGFTPEAGLTLITVSRRNGYEVLGVILNATNRRDDAKDLLDYSFKKLGVK